MKKGLAALVAACFLFVGGGQAQAVVGIPDDVPANTLLYPFFKVNPSRTASKAQDTLIVITNTDNQFEWVHVILWSVKSVHVYDFNVLLTPYDVYSCSLYDLILGNGCPSGVGPAPTRVATDLLASGQLRGYATVDAVTASTSLLPDNPLYPRDDDNILIGHEYIVDLPAGSATGLNAVSIEFVDPMLGHPAVGFGTVNGGGIGDTTTGFFTPTDGLERIDGFEGDLAQTGTADTLNWWQIIRYFTAEAPTPNNVCDASDTFCVDTELWLWKDSNLASAVVNIAVYDEAENFHSVNLDMPFEVNFVKVRDIITPKVPGGWFRIQLGPDTQSVAYSLQLANDADATLRWDAIFPAHRQYSDYLPN
jgi:hypothetical protein